MSDTGKEIQSGTRIEARDWKLEDSAFKPALPNHREAFDKVLDFVRYEPTSTAASTERDLLAVQVAQVRLGAIANQALEAVRRFVDDPAAIGESINHMSLDKLLPLEVRVAAAERFVKGVSELAGGETVRLGQKSHFIGYFAQAEAAGGKTLALAE